MTELRLQAPDLALQRRLRRLVRGRGEAVRAAGRDNMIEAMRVVAIEEPCATLEVAIALCLACRDLLGSPKGRDALVRRGSAWLASQGLIVAPIESRTVPLAQTCGAGDVQRVVATFTQANRRATKDGASDEGRSDRADNAAMARSANDSAPDRVASPPDMKETIGQGRRPGERAGVSAGLSALTAANETLAAISRLALERMHSIEVAKSQMSIPSQDNVVTANCAGGEAVDYDPSNGDGIRRPNEEELETPAADTATADCAAICDCKAMGTRVEACSTPNGPGRKRRSSVSDPRFLSRLPDQASTDDDLSELEALHRQLVSRTGRGPPPREG